VFLFYRRIFLHFCRSRRLPRTSNSVDMKHLDLMKGTVWAASLTFAGGAALVTGCAERRVEYVPVYRTQPAYVVQQPSPPPVAYQVQPAPAPRQIVVVVPSAPPAARVEVIPAPPGPHYVWTPGYYAWNGGWVWIGGRYVVRPRAKAVWVGGHWAPHGHGYVWIGGGWR
jgi:WXXGXW repeat (2 copies)